MGRIYETDTVEAVIEFCKYEGKVCDSVAQLASRELEAQELLKKAYDARAEARLEARRLTEALGLIELHAQLDLEERGIREAERYVVLAREALNPKGTNG